MSRESVRERYFPYTEPVTNDLDSYVRAIFRQGREYSRSQPPFSRNPVVAHYQAEDLRSYFVIHSNQVLSLNSDYQVPDRTLIVVESDKGYFWTQSSTNSLATPEGLDAEIDFAVHVTVEGLCVVLQNYDTYMRSRAN